MTTVGEIQLIATIDTSQYKRGANDIKQKNKEIESSAEQSSTKTSNSWSKVAKVGLAAVATAAIAVGAVITKNVDNAIKRVDTLNNSARTFANMGFATKDVDRAMKDLDQSIRGLPTSLDAGVRGVQSLAATYDDVNKGQKVFTAINNAILGFGGSAQEVENAIQQLSQVPMDGPLDAQTWNSLRQSGLTPALVAMAKKFGMSLGELKGQLGGEGKLTVKDFTDALVDMNKRGGGGMASFEQIAKDATSGISTGWQNMNTAITRGIASIIQSVGSQNIFNAISGFGKGMESALKAVGAFIPKIVELGRQVGEYLGPKLTALWNTISTQLLPALNNLWKNVIQPLIPVIGTSLVVAIGLAIDAINLIVLAITPLVNWLGQNKEAVWAVIGAITAWYTIMKVTAGFNAMYNSIAIARARLIGLQAQMGSTRAAFGLLNKALSTPITISIFVGAALIAIQKVWEAAQKTLKVLDELNASREGLSRSTTDAMERSQKLLRQARASGDKQAEARILRSMKAIAGAASGYAQGGFTGQGPTNEIAGVVHKGEFVIPKNLVDQNTGTPKMGGVTNEFHGDIIIAKEVDADRFFERLTKEQEIISKGMTPGAFNV